MTVNGVHHRTKRQIATKGLLFRRSDTHLHNFIKRNCVLFWPISYFRWCRLPLRVPCCARSMHSSSPQWLFLSNATDVDRKSNDGNSHTTSRPSLLLGWYHLSKRWDLPKFVSHQEEYCIAVFGMTTPSWQSVGMEWTRLFDHSLAVNRAHKIQVGCMELNEYCTQLWRLVVFMNLLASKTFDDPPSSSLCTWWTLLIVIILYHFASGNSILHIWLDLAFAHSFHLQMSGLTHQIFHWGVIREFFLAIAILFKAHKYVQAKTYWTLLCT